MAEEARRGSPANLCSLTRMDPRCCIPRPCRLGLPTSGASRGSAVLVDGASVVSEMLDSDPSAVHTLFTPASVRFGNATERSAVLSLLVPGSRAQLRYRDDGLADYSNVREAITAFRTAVEQFKIEFEMHAGDGYILQNGRWLHGRTGFIGARQMNRLLGRIGDKERATTLRPGFDFQFSAADQIAS
jgi:Taurine catabolism dioxygenase TauD, TfdA family